MTDAATTKAIIFTAVTTPFWLLQISVIVFLLYCRHKKLEAYNTTFFRLFTMLCVLDSFSEFLNFLGLRLIAFNFIHPFVLSSPLYSSIFYLGTAYVLYTQCFLHLSIAINRIWTVYSIMRDFSPNISKFGNAIVAVIPFFTIPLLIPRFFYTAVYFLNVDGSLSLRYTDTSIQKYQSTTATCIIVFTAVPTFIIEIITVRHYRALFKNNNVLNNKKWMQEYRLLCQAMIVLIVQVLVCIFQVMIYISTLTKNTVLFASIMSFYAYIGDLLNLTGPVALIAVSSNFRRDYIQFWFTVFGIRNSGFINSTVNAVTVIKVSRITSEK